MRTTVTLDEDVVAEIERLRREEGLGPSAAINRLVRQAMSRPPSPAPYVHHTADVGVTVDVSNIGDVLDMLDADG